MADIWDNAIINLNNQQTVASLIAEQFQFYFISCSEQQSGICSMNCFSPSGQVEKSKNENAEKYKSDPKARKCVRRWTIKVLGDSVFRFAYKFSKHFPIQNLE